MRLVAVVWLAVFVAACATITKGTTQVVAVNTPGVNGASCTLSSPAIGSLTVVTPDTISLPKASDNISKIWPAASVHDGPCKTFFFHRDYPLRA
jgi:hypothetical protein